MKKIVQIYLLLINFFCLSVEDLIPFYFENRKIEGLVQDLTKIKQANVILPQKVEDLKKFRAQTVTYLPEQKRIEFDTAWALLSTFLELSGFSMFEKSGGVKQKDSQTVYEIVATGTKEQPEISKEPLPLYVDVSPALLPRTEERIRYLYYLKNLNLDQGSNPFTQIFKDIRSQGSPEPMYLPAANGFLLVDKANVISSIISIISALDETGFREYIEVLPINYVAAQDVMEILNTIRKALAEPAGTQVAAGTQVNKNVRSGFLGSLSSDTKFIADNSQNNLIIMGHEASVNQIVDFITENIDRPSESGESILHYYDLQYLDAGNFAPILQKIVIPFAVTSQATQEISSGPFRFFQGVIISHERQVEVYRSPSAIQTQEIDKSDKESLAEIKGLEGQIKIGGNRLIIAALNDDWLAVKDLIEKLDKPQPQVILEAVIAEVRKDITATVASTVRNRTLMPRFSDGIEFLASHITPPFNVLGQNPNRLAQDLLAVVDNENIASLITLIEPGSVLISLNDQVTPGIWGLIQVLNQYLSVDIRDHPHVVCLNNQKSSITRKLQQRNRGDIVPGPNGSFIIPIENITATLNLAMVPHISPAGDLKLEVAIRVEDFIGTSLNRTTRGLSTVATMNSGQILAIGGLIRSETQEFFSYTPILGQIPLLGALFRKETQQTVRNNIIILICPTIVTPRSYDSEIYTKTKLNRSYYDIETEIINQRDPITRLFFNDQTAKENIYDNFCGTSMNLSDTIHCFSPELTTDSYFFPQVREYSRSKNFNSESLKAKLSNQTNNFLSRSNLQKNGPI